MEIYLGACFDSSSINSNNHTFNNIEETRHHIHLEEDYHLLRNEGFTFFRESCWLEKTLTKNGINWDWLDCLAKVSNKKIQLAISHYNYPPHNIYSFCDQLAIRYKGIFLSYIPFVESGTYCHMLTEYLKPKATDWWSAWRKISARQAMIALVLKAADKHCKIALSEPFNSFNNYDDEARPFNTLLGKYDAVAVEHNCNTFRLGNPDLLDMIGLNILHYDDKQPIHLSILEAARRWPDREIFIAETTNVWHQHITQREWLDYMITEIRIAQSLGCRINKLFYCPAIQMFAHDTKQLIGGSLFDLNRRKLY